MRWQIAVASLLAGLAVLFGVYFIYRQVGLERPLVKALKADPAVQEVKVSDDNRGHHIEVALGPVDDLQQAYDRLDRIAERFTRGEPYDLKVTDRRNAILEDTYYRMQFLLQEALARGDFEAMYTGLEQQAAQRNLDVFKVYVDEGHLYLQIGKGANYLYAVIPRNVDPTAAAISGGAGR